MLDRDLGTLPLEEDLDIGRALRRLIVDLLDVRAIGALLVLVYWITRRIWGW